ncbi:hypothetical protein BT96DRAFT_958716 [Gymnopus androsaceus JB14]|uniref:Ribosome production factor 2 homolog n=1 Tax=Gymnopus androsaceus JB14 TaxID=1447944 RepID=A0A6A4HB36_9AGAR|nr:hypothetical protein BT96DRAFT_958716 [Gymnopus androsaceus JB14]
MVFFNRDSCRKRKPKNACSIRDMDAREPKEVEDTREVLNGAMKDLASKNDAPVFPIGKTSKKRPNDLVFVRMKTFDSHPRFIQLKSMLMSLFNGEAVESIYHVISVFFAPTPPTIDTAFSSTDSMTPLPEVHIRIDNIRMLSSGSRIPRLLKQAMKRHKLKTTDVEKGLGKKRKIMEFDEMEQGYTGP